MNASIKLDIHFYRKSIYHTIYRGIIELFLHLTVMKLDIIFAVGVCARFQASPKKSHLQAAKKILIYLKGT